VIASGMRVPCCSSGDAPIGLSSEICPYSYIERTMTEAATAD
jgi:hypothetical protein